MRKFEGSSKSDISAKIQRVYRFGAFTLDAEQKVLLRNGAPLSLTPKAFETLLILVENGGRIVEKDALMNRVWPDTFVEEANLTFNIQQLRKALGDNAREPSFIETVARRGYRFIAQVSEISDEEARYQTNGHAERRVIAIENRNRFPDRSCEPASNTRPHTNVSYPFSLRCIYYSGCWRRLPFTRGEPARINKARESGFRMRTCQGLPAGRP
jgi:DNA-binding winged helix-turn-helix (wHTH) protein